MNITRLNTLNDDKVIIKKEGGNGGNSGGNCEEQQVEYWEFISWDEVPDNPIIDLHGPFQDMMFDFGTFFATVLKSELNGEIKYEEPLKIQSIGNPIAACVIPSKIIQHEIYAPEPMTIEQSLNLLHSPLFAFGVDWRFIIKRKITREEFYADINTDDTYVSKVVVGPAPGDSNAPAMWLDVNTGSVVKNIAGGIWIYDNNGKKMMRIPQNFGQFCLYSPVPIEAPKIISGDVRPYSADKQWYGATTQNLGTVEFELPFGSLVIEVYDDNSQVS